MHNDSRRPPGAVEAFSRFRGRDISDYIYLLTAICVMHLVEQLIIEYCNAGFDAVGGHNARGSNTN